MDRRTEVLKHVSKEAYGIEVGPWFNPLAPKRDGYRCLSFDVFDTENLREIARRDPAIPPDQIPNIENVDIVGSSASIEQLISGRNELFAFDYIISSHNFDHLANPIKFLRGCGRVLKAGGFLSMALPDKRACFDYFRPHTTLAQWLDAFFADQDRPTFMQLFEQNSLHSRLKVGDELRGSFSLSDDPNNIRLLQTLREAYDTWVRRSRNNDATYYDCHCTIMTPNSLRLLLQDCTFLGLSPFEVNEISENNGNEFYVHLRNGGYKQYDSVATRYFYKNRQLVAHLVQAEISYNSICSVNHRLTPAESKPESKILMERSLTLNVGWQRIRSLFARDARS